MSRDTLTYLGNIIKSLLSAHSKCDLNYNTWARLSQDFDSVTGAGNSSDGGRDIVMEDGRVAGGGGCWFRSRLAVIM